MSVMTSPIRKGIIHFFLGSSVLDPIDFHFVDG